MRSGEPRHPADLEACVRISLEDGLESVHADLQCSTTFQPGRPSATLAEQRLALYALLCEAILDHLTAADERTVMRVRNRSYPVPVRARISRLYTGSP